MMNTISFKRVDGGHAFSTSQHDYILVYTPDPSVRGAYTYELVRDNDGRVGSFSTLQDARVYVTNIGFHALDDLSVLSDVPDDIGELTEDVAHSE